MIQTMKKYPAYKDSGIEWLGEIPSHWEIKKMKFLGSIFPGLSGKKGDDFSKEFREDFKPFIPFTNICNNLKIDTDQYQYVHIAEFEVQNKVQKNDILFLMSSETLEDIGKCSLYDGKNKELYLNSFCKGFRFNSNKLSTYFVNYLLQGQIYRNYFSLVGRGFTRINLKQEYINDAPIVLPPPQQQTAIANFLDNKTSKIDTAIAQKEQMIALLKERKQIIIQNAVTGKWSMVNGQWSMTPREKMKDSGVEWIGEIPEEWEVKRLSYITTKIGDGLHGTPEYTDNTDYYFINGNNLSTGFIEITEQTKTVSQKEYLLNKKNIHQGETLLLSINGTIGNVAFYRNETVMLGKSAAYLNFINGVNLEYIKWFLMSESFKNYYELELSGSTINNLSLFSISKTPLTYPSKNEQEKIVEYINVETLKIDQAISLQQTQIEKLKEYKATLIDGAVTGKIMVNG